VIGRLNAALARPRVLPIALAGTVSVRAAGVDGATTLRPITQVCPEPAAMVPPVSVSELSPGVTVPGTLGDERVPGLPPAQMTVAFGVGAMAMPAGSVSVKLVSGRSVAASLLVRVMVSLVTSPTKTGEGANSIAPVGEVRVLTASVAVAAVALVIVEPPSTAENPEINPPGVNPFEGPSAGTVVLWFPGVVDPTLTVNVQLPSAPPETAAGTVPPERMMVVPPAGALADVKPQLSVVPGVAEIATPAARLTVIAAAVRLLAPLLKMDTARVLGSPGLIVAGVKLRLTVAVAHAALGNTIARATRRTTVASNLLSIGGRV
jgi:hypothetical protein